MGPSHIDNYHNILPINSSNKKIIKHIMVNKQMPFVPIKNINVLAYIIIADPIRTLFFILYINSISKYHI